MKSFNKYCNEIKDKYYNCDKVVKTDYSFVISSIIILLFSTLFQNLYIFSVGTLLFLIFIYLLFAQRKFWLAEVPHYAYCHFNNADEQTTNTLLKTMHWNNKKEPKLLNFNIFFPITSSLLSKNQAVYFDFQYCFNKSKLNESLKYCSSIAQRHLIK